MKLVKKLSVFITAAIISAPAWASPLTVEVNKTQPLRLRGEATDVVIGNSNVADVAVLNSRTLFITGKTYGSTNLMVYDENGRQIYSSDIVVTSNSTSTITVNRAGADFTYDCTPNCRPTPSIGDATEYFDQVVEQTQRIQELSSSD